MKRVIGGKVYNTETAEEVVYIGNHLGRSDFGWEETYLYRSPKGTWFVAGKGGPASRWRRKDWSNSYGNGEGLEPCYSDNEVLELLEHHNQTDLIEKYFADKIEDA